MRFSHDSLKAELRTLDLPSHSFAVAATMLFHCFAGGTPNVWSSAFRQSWGPRPKVNTAVTPFATNLDRAKHNMLRRENRQSDYESEPSLFVNVCLFNRTCSLGCAATGAPGSTAAPSSTNSKSSSSPESRAGDGNLRSRRCRFGKTNRSGPAGVSLQYFR